MKRYLCQPDGGQWNIEVWVEEDCNLLEELGDNVIVHGKDLVSWCVDAAGEPISLVPISWLHETPQS